MATATQPAIETTEGGLIPYRLTVSQFEQMIGAGVFPDDAHVELLGGVLAEQMTKYAPHDYTVERLGKLLDRLAYPGWVVREEKSIILGPDWRPEPDVAVARGSSDRYRALQPVAADLALLVEVADSSYAIDRGVKWREYAAAGVPVYWIANLSKRTVEIYSNPTGGGESAMYRDAVTCGSDDAAPLVIESREVGRIVVQDILP
jgi:Uma2 family endonuclease